MATDAFVSLFDCLDVTAKHATRFLLLRLFARTEQESSVTGDVSALVQRPRAAFTSLDNCQVERRHGSSSCCASILVGGGTAKNTVAEKTDNLQCQAKRYFSQGTSQPLPLCHGLNTQGFPASRIALQRW